MGAAFNQPIPTDGDKWDTVKVTSMLHMFQGAEKFNQELKTWDTKAVKNMKNMFKGAVAFNKELAGTSPAWDLSAVETMEGMFEGATDFNLDLTQAGGKWDTGEVTTMQNMFNGAAKFNKDLTSWNTKLGKVTNNVGMWTGATAMTSTFKPCTNPATSVGQVTWPAC